MRISRINLLYGALAIALLHSALNAFEPQIKLAGRKDLVLGIDTRQTVLEVGMTHLATEKDDYMARIDDLKDPFSFKESTPVKPVVADNADPEEPPDPEALAYDDASVLDASAASFVKKVRGSLARGDTSYLQLEGGVLLKPGTSFPVRLPQAKGQTFTLTITEITSDGYTLQIGEATKQISFNGKSQPNAIQFSNP